VASLILEVRGMLFQQWIVLFSTACFGNLVGLNVSAGMRSAVSIYILIPLILVPHLLLGGAMIKFDDLHKSMSRKIYVPVIGDMMVTRWAYEAITVEQFKRNGFEKPFFNYDMEISQNDWYASFLLPTLKATLNEVLTYGKNSAQRNSMIHNLKKINYHINGLAEITGIMPGGWIKKMDYDDFNESTADQAKTYLDSLAVVFRVRSNEISAERNELYNKIVSRIGSDAFLRIREEDYNENLADILLNRMEKNKIYDAGDRFIQKADPVFMHPGSRYGRAHFYAPYKQIGNLKIGTLLFNVIVIWIMNMMLFAALYYNLLKRLITFMETRRMPILRSYGRELLQI
jgi:hypothetical protein